MHEDDFGAADRAYWRTSFPDVPDMGRLIRHAEAFGSESVYETAEACGYPLPELLQLDAELTRIDTAKKKRFGTVPTRKRPTTDDKVRAVAYMVGEGMPQSRIAKVLNLSERRVGQIWAQARKAAVAA